MSLDFEPRWRSRKKARILQKFLAQVGPLAPDTATSREPEHCSSLRGRCCFDLADLEPDDDDLILTSLPRIQRASIYDFDLADLEPDDDDLILASLPRSWRASTHEWDDEETYFA